MAEDKPQQGAQPIRIITGDELSRGRYSNSMMVTHSAEEFILEWLLNSPSGTHLVSRVIVGPAHVKRVIAALSDNLRKYEERFGAVPAIAGEPEFH